MKAEFLIFLSLIYLVTILIGKLLEKIHIPWIFASLIFGLILSFNNPFKHLLNSEIFLFWAQLGMYFLLFLIGFELDLKKIKHLGSFIIKSTFFIITLETILGGVVLKYLFHLPWLIAFFTATSFATVGEAVLIPILDKLKLMKSKLGNLIIGIGTLDDLIEILIIILMIVLAPTLIQKSTVEQLPHIKTIIFSLIFLTVIGVLFIYLKDQIKKLNIPEIELLFLIILFVLFLFVGIGVEAEQTIGALGALLAGLCVKNLLPQAKLNSVFSDVKTISYGLFAPLFFVWVGSEVNFDYFLIHPVLVILLILTISGAKILGSYLVGKKILGDYQSLLLGLGLSVRFSTSILIIKLLYENRLIGLDLYSVLVVISSLSLLIIPFVFSSLLTKINFKIND